MKKTIYFLLILLTSLTFSCSKDGDNERENLENYSIQYLFEGSRGSKGTLTFSSFSNNNLIEEKKYDNLSEDEFIRTNKFIVESTSIVTGQIKINDSTSAIRGDATIKIINSENEVVADLVEEYLNTDIPPVTDYINLSFNTETGEVNIDRN